MVRAIGAHDTFLSILTDQVLGNRLLVGAESFLLQIWMPKGALAGQSLVRGVLIVI